MFDKKRQQRPSPGKERALILDHVGNVMRHGLPDEIRKWSLDGKKGREKKAQTEGSLKTCKTCFAMMLPHKFVCEFCGTEIPRQERTIAQVDGDLELIDESALKRRKVIEQASAQTIDDLIEIAKRRGYKRPRGWAKHVFNARQRKKIYG